ncbi:MAG TPA: extracellular solute-binding protein [Euzebya sp.]|nr:extracellular solute-binding protein [Euzebya sp.]
MQPHLDASALLDVSDFAEPTLAAFRFDGRSLTCMPQNISSLVVFYNVDLFEEAGVAAPTAGWGWEDFLAAARALTDPAQGRFGVGLEPSLQAEERFIAGQLGMYLDSRRATPTLRAGIAGFGWDVGPLPSAPGGTPSTILHGDAYCLSAAGDSDAGWRFIEHVMTVEGQEILAESGRTVPSRTDVATSPAFLEPDLPPARASVFIEAIPHIRSLPHTSTWSQMQREVDSLLADVYYGRVDREQGITDMIRAAEAIFAHEPPRLLPPAA